VKKKMAWRESGMEHFLFFKIKISCYSFSLL
jgi:hypothetical protein